MWCQQAVNLNPSSYAIEVFTNHSRSHLEMPLFIHANQGDPIQGAANTHECYVSVNYSEESQGFSMAATHEAGIPHGLRYARSTKPEAARKFVLSSLVRVP